MLININDVLEGGLSLDLEESGAELVQMALGPLSGKNAKKLGFSFLSPVGVHLTLSRTRRGPDYSRGIFKGPRLAFSAQIALKIFHMTSPRTLRTVRLSVLKKAAAVEKEILRASLRRRALI